MPMPESLRNGLWSGVLAAVLACDSGGAASVEQGDASSDSAPTAPTMVTASSAPTMVTAPTAPTMVTAPTAPTALRVLVFTRTAGYRHASIADAATFFAGLDASEALDVEQTEEPSMFTQAELSRFDVVAFVNTTGDVLDAAQEQALQAFVQGGGGWVGVHAAADTEHDWPWYGELVGATFVNHPETPLPATLTRETNDSGVPHRSVAHWPESFRFTDEWYNFDRNPRAVASVLLTVDEADFVVPNVPAGPSMGGDHPVAWYAEFDGGRSFYTNLGHRPETWRDPGFQRHLLEGMRWAGGGE